MNAYDYGLPQNRDRLFIVGIKNSIKHDFNFPFPVKKSKLLAKIIDGLEINKNHLDKKNLFQKIFLEKKYLFQEIDFKEMMN